MPSKSVALTARIGNADLQIRFYMAGSQPRVSVLITADVSGGGTQTYEYDQAVANTSLTPANRAALATILPLLRDEAVAALGFI